MGGITNTKPIENLFGNLDREIKKAGPTGFNKAADDMIISTSKDLIIPNKFEWRIKANRKKAIKLSNLDKMFNHKQNEIAESSSGSTSERYESTVLHCISKCKTTHNGPLTTVKELEDLVKKFKDDDKSLHYSLNLEIRLRKLTLNKIKKSCPLFKQNKLTDDKKI